MTINSGLPVRGFHNAKPSRVLMTATALTLALFVTSAAVAAGGPAVDDTTSPHVRTSLLIDERSKPARVGVLFDLAPGWHVYWKNPGDTGLAPELEWQVDRTGATPSTGSGVGDIEWPAPIPFDGSGNGIASYGYDEQVLLTSEVSNVEGATRFTVAGSVLICKDECIPVDFDLSRARGDAGGIAGELSLFDQYRKRVPQDPNESGLALNVGYSHAELQPGDAFEAGIAIAGCHETHTGCERIVGTKFNTFFPDEETDEALSLEVLGLAPHPTVSDVSVLQVRGIVELDADEAPSFISGVLRLTTSGGVERAIEVALPFPAPGVAATAGTMDIAPAWMTQSASASSERAGETAGTQAALPWLRVLLLALIGGLILNGMPCVLPVLGIKICSAAELAQHDPGELRRHGFAYLAGVLASMAALAAAVVSLKAAGSSVGWGFQFQEPMFVAIVSVIVVLFALNLFGVFEIQISTQRLSEVGANTQGPTRSFFDGLLAVVLATPCTAPFLGTAVGFAFAGGSALIVATFLAIGAGLAAPYTLICLIPGWSRYVPRAGGWMLRLRAGLGFLLLATAVWLLWIFGRTAGVDGLATLLAVLVAISFGVWLFGWVQMQSRPMATIAAGCALILFGATAINRIEVTPQQEARLVGDERWVNYDPTAIGEALDAGKPVFVSFTADWCITCKVNERGVLADDRVRASLDLHGYRWFRGDWTQRDEAIRAELARHGRAGVPLYLVYHPSDPAHPQVLPELLSVDLVIDAFATASATGNEST